MHTQHLSAHVGHTQKPALFYQSLTAVHWITQGTAEWPPYCTAESPDYVTNKQEVPEKKNAAMFFFAKS